MVGLIWVIQILHYPAFADVHEDKFCGFHSKHSNRITFIVVPVMLLELATAVLLIRSDLKNIFFLGNLLMIIALWSATALLSVPIHNELSKKQDIQKIHRLVKTNWVRTSLWSLRLLCLSIYFFLHQGSYVNFN